MDWFAKQLLRWHGIHGRKNLPWQIDKSPYRVWLAEIMLQQTQVATVIPYYHAFVKRFPSLVSLANATEDEVLHLWTGLGYYRRARMLFQTAQTLHHKYNGAFPANLKELCDLPGIGRSTAGAILSCSFGISAPILDGNARRVLSRFHAISDARNGNATEKTLWQFAEFHTPSTSAANYTQAIMDLGAGICTRTNPKCVICPLSNRCKAFLTDSVSDYPKKTKKKIKREESMRVLLILDKFNRCLVQKRPETGIWANLWAPPEIPFGQSVETVLTECGLPQVSDTGSNEKLTLVHVLSHIRLTIEAIPVRYSMNFEQSETPPGFRWYSVNADDQLGVSAATLKLLDAATKPASIT